MLSYELCKKLKEAGLTQPKINNDSDAECPHCSMFVWWDEDGTSWNTRERWPETDDWYLYPTLSKLIEACGERFVRLEKNDTSHLEAFPDYSEWRTYCMAKGENIFAHTPEEAVAKLYLSLNS